MLPEVIDDVSEGLKQTPLSESEKPGQPDATNTAPPPLTEGTPHILRPVQHPPKVFKSALPLWLFLSCLLLTGGLILGVKLWLKQRTRQEMLGQYALEGQTSYNEIEALYAKVDQFAPSFHVFQGETQTTLRLYTQELRTLQTDYNELFDRYEDESSQLNDAAHTLETIDFFRELEKAISRGQALIAQGHNILKNLEKIKQDNQQKLVELTQYKQRFHQELQELRKINPALRLSQLSSQIQKYAEQLQQMENINHSDPIQIEKQIPQWQKKLVKIERETRTLPHLWQQFKQELGLRLDSLQQKVPGYSETQMRNLS